MIDATTALALTDAGYMPLADYIALTNPQLHVGTFRQPTAARGCEAHPAGSPVNAGPDVQAKVAAKGGKGGLHSRGGNV